MIQAGFIKEVTPDFSKIASPFKLFRYDSGDSRFYMTLNQDGSIKKHYLSVTAFCAKSLPTSRWLIEWMKKNGENADYMRDERAAYGTTLHIYIGKSLKEGRVNYDECRMFAIESAIATGNSDKSPKWMMDLCHDVHSFYQFFKDKVIDIIAMEFPIISDKWGVGGTTDLVARVKFGRSAVNAIVDYKSGRKGFFETHQLQLQTYKVCWNEWFSDVFPVSHVFNWAPKAWKNVPTYSFENQTGSSFATTVISRLRISKAEEWNTPPKETAYLKGEFDIRDFVSERHIEMLRLKHEYQQQDFEFETESTDE